jgi:SAM-dependent methyltransferase
MVGPSETATRFNQISEIYDETRQPLTPEGLDRAAAILNRDGVRRILEAGVGTGRIAVPLQQRQFEILGVDLARGMLSKAREKGVEGLILADANHLPLRDKQFDAALMAHVIHLLEDPGATFESLRRVARREIVAFVRKRDGTQSDDEGRSPFREAFRAAADELGYQRPDRPGDWWSGFRKESEFLASVPPSELVTIEDRLIVTTVRERISYIEKRGYIHPSGIPEEAYHKIMKRMAESVDADREVRFRRAEQMAIWRLTD